MALTRFYDGVKRTEETYYNLNTNGIATNIREKFWAVREASSDWAAWVSTNDATSAIDRYTSTDGLSWSADGTNPVISESFSLQDPSVVIDSGTYYLYCEDAGNADAIRIYTSTDGQSWTFDSEFTNSFNPQSPVVVIDSGTWYLFYEKYSTRPYETRYATSTDGTTFTDQGVAVPEDTQIETVCDDIFKVGDRWIMSVHLIQEGGFYQENTKAEQWFATAPSLTDTFTLQGRIVDYSDWGSGAQSLTVPHDPAGNWAGEINGGVYGYLWDNGTDNTDLCDGVGFSRGPNGPVKANSGPLLVDTSNLAAYWPMEEGTGARLHAKVSPYLRAELLNGAWTGGAFNNAPDFTPANATSARIPTLQLDDTDDFAWAALAKTTSDLNFQPLVAQRQDFDTADWYWFLEGDGSGGTNMGFGVGESGASLNQDVLTGITQNSFQLFGIIKNGTDWTLYDTGNSTTLADSTSWTTSDYVELGSWEGGLSSSTFDGPIDRMWYWDAAITVSDLDALAARLGL